MSWFRRLNLAAAILCFVVVVFGAYVRLSDAGLGCPDWPGCYGHLSVPAAQQALASAQDKPLRPLEAPKAWKEMIHRYLASTLGLLIVGLALQSVALRGRGAPRKLPWVLVGLVIFQGLLGMWTVTWQLKPLAVSGHLLGGMATLSLLTWMWLSQRWPATRTPSAAEQAGMRARAEREVRLGMLHRPTETTDEHARAPDWIRLLAPIALGLLGVQIFLGGWTSSNYAALACPDFPTCHGQWWPQTDFKGAFTLWRGLGVNYEHGVLDNRARVTIHFFHRVGALIVLLVLAQLGAVLLFQRRRFWQKLGWLMLGALALQLGIGASMVKLQVPLALADLHNAGAAALLLSLVVVNYFAFKRGR